MLERVRSKQAWSDRQNVPPKAEIKRNGAASVRCLKGPAADAVLALVGLGYTRSVAESAIRAVREKTTEAATAPELIKLGLKNISRLI
jgi:Holliday junction resolvasome RuvABC DNA-binding subunit